MGFLNNVGGLFKTVGKNTGEIAKQVGDKTGDLIESAKITNKINAENAVVAAQYAKLGEDAYNKAAAGAEVDDEVRAFCDVINAAKQNITALEAEMEKLKEQAAAQNEAIKHSAAETGEALKDVAAAAAAGASEVVSTASAKVKEMAKNVKAEAKPEATEGEQAYAEAVENVTAPAKDGPACPACGEVNAMGATTCVKCGTVLLTVPAEEPKE